MTKKNKKKGEEKNRRKEKKKKRSRQKKKEQKKKRGAEKKKEEQKKKRRAERKKKRRAERKKEKKKRRRDETKRLLSMFEKRHNTQQRRNKYQGNCDHNCRQQPRPWPHQNTPTERDQGVGFSTVNLHAVENLTGTNFIGRDGVSVKQLVGLILDRTFRLVQFSVAVTGCVAALLFNRDITTNSRPLFFPNVNVLGMKLFSYNTSVMMCILAADVYCP